MRHAIGSKKNQLWIEITDQFTRLVGLGAGFAWRRPPLPGTLPGRPRPDRKRRGAPGGQASHHPRSCPPFRPVARRRHRRVRDPGVRRLCRGPGGRGHFRRPERPPPAPRECRATSARSRRAAARLAVDSRRDRARPAHDADLPPIDDAPSRPATGGAVPLWRSARQPGAAGSHRRLYRCGTRRALPAAPDRDHGGRAAGPRPSHPRHHPTG